MQLISKCENCGKRKFFWNLFSVQFPDGIYRKLCSYCETTLTSIVDDVICKQMGTGNETNR